MFLKNILRVYLQYVNNRQFGIHCKYSLNLFTSEILIELLSAGFTWWVAAWALLQDLLLCSVQI